MSNRKKELGQFFTDPNIAKFMAKMAISDNTKNLLDPAVGPGIFVEKAHELSKKLNIECFEVDNKMIDEYKKNINFDTSIKNEDYLYSTTELFDAIICNPPYNKFQKIKDRKELIKLFEKKYGIKLSGYTNYCMYFLIKSLNEIKTNGKCIYIIPYEFMNAGYGEVIKEYLLRDKKLTKIIRFDSQIKLFDDAMTTSCILCFENKNNDYIDFINVDSLEDFDYICNNNYETVEIKRYSYSDLDAKEKWLKYFNVEKENYKNLIQFKDYSKVKRGIATGSNNFFNLNVEMINKYKLSKEVCIPCVTKSPDIKKMIITNSYFDELVSQGKKMYIFDGRNKKSKFDDEYIQYGESMNVDKSYLNSHRVPWYGIEDKDSAPIWISVFSRDKLKIIRNELMIKNLTTFHGIYPNFKDEESINIFYCYLITPIAQKILRMNKREYGEGLDKFEPNDLNNAKILDFSVIEKKDKIEILKIYEILKNTDVVPIERLEEIFLKYL